MKKWGMRLVAVVAGCAATVAVAAVAFGSMRVLWPAYEAAGPDKSYTLAMLIARLAIGALCAAGGGVAATLVARDGRIAWWLGGLFLLLSLRPHLVTLWDEYPAWYHFVYLGYLVPVAGLSGGLVRGRYLEATPSPPATTASETFVS